MKFRGGCQGKDLKVEVEDCLLDSDDEPNFEREHICTDWNIYEAILFHLLKNAIKFAKKSTKIFIQSQFVVENDLTSGLGAQKAFLVTKVINFGS